MKRFVFLFALAALTLSGCKKIKFSGFKIEAIETFKLPEAPDNSLMQFKAEGPGMNELTQWRNYGDYSFSTAGFEGDKAKKDYTLTLIRKTGNTETEVSEMTIDFGDYLDQDAFFVENNDMRIKLYVAWDARW